MTSTLLKKWNGSSPSPWSKNGAAASSNAREGECPLIELKDVQKVFKTAAGAFTALKDINLVFEAGEFVSIMGKSGSGKSTLINMISGIDHPSSGSIQVGCVEVHAMSQGNLAAWRGRNLGIVFQFFQLMPMLTVLENTILPMDLCSTYPSADREGRALELLKMFDLLDVADKLPAALSGGQQQIAAIARALANDPPIILGDEPTGNLDSVTATNVLHIFDKLASQGKTILLVTHDPSVARHTHRKVLISDGQLINPFVAQAIHWLSHPQMLWVTHQVEPRTFQPGEIILNSGQPAAGLYILASGEVELFCETGDDIHPITPGKFFGQPDLDMSYNQGLRAAQNGPVQVLWLAPQEYGRLITEAPQAAQAMNQVAKERIVGDPPLEGARKLLGIFRRKGAGSGSNGSKS